MDPSDVIQSIILFILLLLSAFFSASETALTTTNKHRIRALADDNVKPAKTVLKLIEEPSKMLSAILIGNNVVNLSASSLATTLVIRTLGNKWIGVGTGILTLLILVFAEITPKSLSTNHSDKVALKVSGPIYFITKILDPVIFIVNKVSIGIMKLLRIDPNAKAAAMTENELLNILDYSQEEGVIESEEREMMNNVVEFGDSLAKDVMVPRIDMDFISTDLAYDELVQAFIKNKYTRLPVYSENRDNVIGIVNIKDLFFYDGDKDDFNLEDILRTPYFTYEYKKTSELLIEMRGDSISLAIVLDEYGATAGLLTIEDLLEEIVGEIRDEYDEDEEDCIQFVSDNEYIVDGNTKIDDFNDALETNIESSDYDSIAGHIIFLLDHLPKEGETITDENIVYTVMSVIKNRIDKIHVFIDETNGESMDLYLDTDTVVDN